MRVELVWVGPHAVLEREYQVTAPCTVADVLSLAAQEPRFAQAHLESATVGLFGRIVSRAEMLADGDRLEIYRGAAVDPKIARRARAAISRAKR